VKAPISLGLCLLLLAALAPRAPAQVSGIARFAVIDEGLSRGARPSAEAISDLRRHGYRTVVSFVHDPAEGDRVRAAGMQYVEIPMSATLFGAAAPTDRDLERFFGVVLDSTARPVFMHCVHGKDRTGAMAAIYRIEVSGWTSAQAIAEMDRMGFNGMYRTLHRFVRSYVPRGYGAKRQAPSPAG
jgi:protein tyrosine phosphatase (PTP) superfamily phosphohydrolase (DUF442 family)